MPLPEQTRHLLAAARLLHKSSRSEAILLLPEHDLDWDEVLEVLEGIKVIVAPLNKKLADTLTGRPGFHLLSLDYRPVLMRERLSLALLEALTAEMVRQGSNIVAVYNGIESEDSRDPMDSISVIYLGDHLERLSARELRQLDTRVPLETLKAVVDLATDIGREGREGKPVGTLLVVGDTRKVLSLSRVIGFDPVRGYSKKERNLRDKRVRESMKEICKLDGAIIVNKDGTVEAAARFISVPAEGITLSKGLGSRHWTAAAISKQTQAIAVVVSESTGGVRVFQNGEVVLHIAPHSRPILWRNLTGETQSDIGTTTKALTM
ncbi:MAG TPA: DNA integrity scanning protein DisA nucleotide-binding domain protein [Gemmatales bacterium]|nr:DNA integrity scanning protein DisA nucleotide-binding domain protein [Gemmatales bacterium]